MDKSTEWLLVVVSNAPIKTTDEARQKAYWLNKLADELDKQLEQS